MNKTNINRLNSIKYRTKINNQKIMNVFDKIVDKIVDKIKNDGEEVVSKKSNKFLQRLDYELKQKEIKKQSENTINKDMVGERIMIPVNLLEFNVQSHTLWIQSPEGGTVLRIKCTGKINIDQCTNSPISHSDLIVLGDINFCLSNDSNLNK